MKLADKGRFAPPPKLEPLAQRVSESLAAWEGVHARTHWLLGDEQVIDGADFYSGEDEIGHLHLDSQAHVFHDKPVAELLVKSGLARPFPWGKNIVVFAIERRADIEHALWLFKLSYDRCRGATPSELLARVKLRVAKSGRSQA